MTTTIEAQDATAWVKDLFALVDVGDSEALIARMAPEASMRFGNADAVSGHAEMLAGSQAFHSSITAISHAIVHAVRLGSVILTELEVTYTRLDGQVLTLPCTNVFELDGEGLITRYQIFMDIAPVYA
ncbi:nuclear transport factor 2 family protein [Aeromicrobium sp. CFBP 8757]|uniref:nuclear transport factor 2 family protein n=1 Tax=Aeromicrobium sp. CFBP 8757 TaxID=2775288 RepID=UPI00177BE0D7|nr:nuclear transport factor 2 family protein [Aeromicrobium sp. CFBP 8757]MBD8605448.1 nuclear transport factor 2 family protein [Aeromicrobium sp. CFBP 8757]